LAPADLTVKIALWNRFVATNSAVCPATEPLSIQKEEPNSELRSSLLQTLANLGVPCTGCL
jgi:hypothetical protein